MKKSLILFGLIIMATVSQAASFKWNVVGSKTYFGTEKKSVTATLVYLGNLGDAADYTFVKSIVADPQVATANSLSTPVTFLGNFQNQTYTVYDNNKILSDGDDIITPGVSAFGLFLTYNDGIDTWYNVSSDVYVLASDASDINNKVSTTFAFDWKVNEKGVVPDPIKGGGWYSVPEPATGALALAGLALLFRRRRA